MLVATPPEDGTARLDPDDVPCLPVASRRESIDSAVVKVAEIGFGVRGSRKYSNVRGQPERWTRLGRRNVERAKKNQDGGELQEKLFSKEGLPVHDSLGGITVQLVAGMPASSSHLGTQLAGPATSTHLSCTELEPTNAAVYRNNNVAL